MSGRLYLGGFLVIIGLGMLLERLGLIPFGDWVSTYWPSILIILGIYQLTRPQISTWSGIILLAVGGIWQLLKLDILATDSLKFVWPLAIIAIGLAMLLPRRERPSNTGDRLGYIAVFSGVKTRSNSERFSGGSVTAILGGADIDLRGAMLATRGANLDLTAVLGGIDLRVPQDWRVEITGLLILGGWSDKTDQQLAEGAPVLRIHCFVLLGGVDIKN
jgi:hypothetical protein